MEQPGSRMASHCNTNEVTGLSFKQTIRQQSDAGSTILVKLLGCRIPKMADAQVKPALTVECCSELYGYQTPDVAAAFFQDQE